MATNTYIIKNSSTGAYPTQTVERARVYFTPKDKGGGVTLEIHNKNQFGQAVMNELSFTLEEFNNLLKSMKKYETFSAPTPPPFKVEG